MIGYHGIKVFDDEHEHEEDTGDMSKFSILRFLHPARALAGVRRRGVRGSLLHLLRKLGTMAERPLVGPYLLRINPMGAVCNHACPMCWLQHIAPAELKENQRLDRELGMTLAEYQSLFNAMPAGLQEVNLVGGGEPLIHPDAVEIMREVKRRRWRGLLITNGTLLREGVARAMTQMRWDHTRVSVHAGDRETFLKIHGVDRFETLRQNLRAFDRLRREAGAREACELVVFNVIQRENLATLDKLFAFAEEVGADSVVFEKVIMHTGDAPLSAGELRGARETLAAGAAACPVPCNLEEILGQLALEEAAVTAGKPFRPGGRCSVGFDQVFVNSTGDVTPCCFSNEIMGHLREQSFGEIWKSKKFQNFRRRLIRGKFPKYCYEVHCAMKAVLHE